MILIKKGNSILEKQIYTFIEENFLIAIGSRDQSSVHVVCDSISKCHAIIDYDNDNDYQ